MITLNNPLVLIGGAVLGFGFSLHLDRVDGTTKLCFMVEAVAWSYCKEWGG